MQFVLSSDLVGFLPPCKAPAEVDLQTVRKETKYK